ncbi:MAG: ABC transporter ATP-binding protein [Candidatus Gracilibacteria bacterium]|nr:ABC transporter ATP-binding protein [Candidatus Gracilibacteria bacterium]
MKKIIEVKGLSKVYEDGFKSLDNINFDVMEGDIYGFLGHNGAGKTTTINILTTLLEPTSGDAFINGNGIIKDSFEIKKIIGYLPENVQMYSNFTVYENLEYFAKLSGIEKPKKRIDEVLKFLEVDYADKKVGGLSKGMKQRIGIAQAILHEPKVLFLDEPNTGLDPVGMKQLRDIIIKLNTEKGITIFMNTHLLSEVGKLCNRVGILNQGKIIFSGTIEELKQKYPDDNSLENIYLKIEKNG